MASERKKETGPSGRRSELNIAIDRENTDSLLPAIPLVNKVMCIDHCAGRVAEKLIRLTLEAIMSTIYSTDRDKAMEYISNFITNLTDRDVPQASRIEIVDHKIKVKDIKKCVTVIFYCYIRLLRLARLLCCISHEV